MRSPLSLDLEAAAAELNARLASAYLAGVTGSRLIGAETALSDLGSLDVWSPPANDTGGPYRSTVRSSDIARAQRASRGYSSHWLEDALEAHRLGEDPIASALRSQDWRLELGAATENSAAIASEKARVHAEWVARNPAAAALLAKVWDAELDKRTCQVCWGSHGEIVMLNEPFSQGEPGQVHPRCRCTYHVIALAESVAA